MNVSAAAFVSLAAAPQWLTGPRPAPAENFDAARRERSKGAIEPRPFGRARGAQVPVTPCRTIFGSVPAANAPGQRLTAEHGRGNFWVLALGSVGVVFGDIGTSPLYALQTALGQFKTAARRRPR